MRLSFSQSPLDHAGLKRSDPDWVRSRLDVSSAKVLLFNGINPVLEEAGIVRVFSVSEARELSLDSELVYLGEQGESPWFAGWTPVNDDMPPQDFRLTAMHAELDFSAIMGRARSIVAWRQRRTYCSNCSTRNEPRDGGLRLKCPGCGMDHFPRVDPSVIMLPVHGERCVMGRQANWPPGMFATLAGFIEPGETFEEACARETMEEIGLKVLSTRYIASQPWPFPSSLMIGLIAEIEDGEVKPDDDLEDARWFTRDEARELYDVEMARWAPRNFSISRLLIDTWLNKA